jgi:outer membrane protein assembly factor BamB
MARKFGALTETSDPGQRAGPDYTMAPRTIPQGHGDDKNLTHQGLCMKLTILSSIVILSFGVACSPPRANTIWSFRTDRPWLAGDSQAFTPVVDDELAFFCGGYSYADQAAIHALSLRDGSLRWKHRVGKCVSAPFLTADTLIVHAEEPRGGPCVLQGYDQNTGATKWRHHFREADPVSVGRCSIHGAEADGRIVFAFLDDQAVQSLRALDGSLQRFSFPQEPRRHHLWLTRSGPTAWFGFGTHVWSWPTGTPQPNASSDLAVEDESPDYSAIAGGMLLLGQRRPGRLRAFDLETGAFLWEQGAFPQILNVTAIDDTLFVNIWRNRFELVSVDRTTGRELWSAGDGGFYSPIAHGGRLYANGEFAVFVSDAATGKILHTIESGVEVTTTPTLAGDLLLFGTIDGALHAVRPEPTGRIR